MEITGRSMGGFPKSLQGHHDLRDQREAPSEGALGGFLRAHATDHLGLL